MDKFIRPDEISRAAHALALATQRGHDAPTGQPNMAGLYALAREVLAQAERLALEEPDAILAEALRNFLDPYRGERDVFNAAAVNGDPVDAIAKEPIDPATLDGAMKLLEDTDPPGTPACAYDSCADLVSLMIGVLEAAWLALGVHPQDAVAHLSDDRLPSQDVRDRRDYEKRLRNTAACALAGTRAHQGDDDRADLFALARAVLAHVQREAEPDEVLREAQSQAEMALSSYTGGTVGRGALHGIDTGGVEFAPFEPEIYTPGDLFDYLAEMAAVVADVLMALRLADGVTPAEAVRELTDGRLNTAPDEDESAAMRWVNDPPF